MTAVDRPDNGHAWWCNMRPGGNHDGCDCHPAEPPAEVRPRDYVERTGYDDTCADGCNDAPARAGAGEQQRVGYEQLVAVLWNDGELSDEQARRKAHAVLALLAHTDEQGP